MVRKLGDLAPADESDLPPFAEDEEASEHEGGIFFGHSFEEYHEIVRYDNAVPGAAGVTYGISPPFESQNFFSAPVFNKNGHAAFAAETDFDAVVLTAFDPNGGQTPDEQRRVVAIHEQDMPGTPNWDAVIPPGFRPSINQAGATTFLAYAKDMSEYLAIGIWAENDAMVLEKVIIQGDPVPNHAASEWWQFSRPVINQEFKKVFWGRHHQLINGQEVSTRGVYLASPTNEIERIAESGQLTPLVPNTTLAGRRVGVFETFADPIMNDTGNVAFIADVDITDSTLQSNLSSLEVPNQFILEKGIFFRDNDGELRTIAATGMKVLNLLDNGDQRVIVNLRFSSNTTAVVFALPGTGSGHQDGLPTGITNTRLTIDDEPPAQLARIAFTAVLATPGDPDPGNLSEGVFVAELLVTETTGGTDPGGGGPCPNCLECILVDCEFGGLLLGLGPDFDQNGVVDDTDLGLMIMSMGLKGGRFDMDNDGIVGEKDLAMLIEDYGKAVSKE